MYSERRDGSWARDPQQREYVLQALRTPVFGQIDVLGGAIAVVGLDEHAMQLI